MHGVGKQGVGCFCWTGLDCRALLAMTELYE